MFKLSQPNFDNLYIINLLVENMADNIPMKSKLQETQNQTDLYAAWMAYDALANRHILHSIPAYTGNGVINNIIGNLNYDDLISIYSNYFSKQGKEVRRIYDAILSQSERCPFCGNIGISSQLDHYLPKKYYPQYSIYPKNLAPICRDCNEGFKKAIYATREEEQWIHPYFDKEIFFNEQWISANYNAIDLEDPLATVEYFVNPPNSWPLVDQERVRQYFSKLNLGIRFSKEANNQLQTLIPQLIRLKQIMQYPMLIDFYRESYTNSERPVNHWERIMYHALYEYIELHPY